MALKRMGLKSNMPFDINWFDIVVVIAIGYGVWNGIRTGLSGELVRAIGLVAMIVIALMTFQPVGTWFEQQTGMAIAWAYLVGFISVAIVILVIAESVRVILHRRLKQQLFTATIENIGGAMAGAIRTLVIMVWLTLILCLLRGEFWVSQIGRQSRFGSFVVQRVPAVAELVHETSQDSLQILQNIKRRADQPGEPPATAD